MADKEPKSTRDRSTIQFPYKDLESATETAKAIHDSGAVSGVAPDQLAALLGITSGTGNFMTRVATARMFGLLGNSTPYQLTELGYEILDKDDRRQRAARGRSFLTVPLYRKLYDTYRGKALPSRPLGLERTFLDFGVTPKQVKFARQAFERSAKQAGFFAAGEDRLVEPLPGSAPPTPPTPTPDAQPDMVINDGHRTTVVQMKPTQMHPFVQGLLQEIPKPGQPWLLADRVEWLRAAVHSFNIIYKHDGEITITGTPKVVAPRPAAPAPAAGGRPAARKGSELDDDIPF